MRTNVYKAGPFFERWSADEDRSTLATEKSSTREVGQEQRKCTAHPQGQAPWRDGVSPVSGKVAGSRQLHLNLKALSTFTGVGSTRVRSEDFFILLTCPGNTMGPWCGVHFPPFAWETNST